MTLKNLIAVPGLVGLMLGFTHAQTGVVGMSQYVADWVVVLDTDGEMDGTIEFLDMVQNNAQAWCWSGGGSFVGGEAYARDAAWGWEQQDAAVATTKRIQEWCYVGTYPEGGIREMSTVSIQGSVNIIHADGAAISTGFSEFMSSLTPAYEVKIGLARRTVTHTMGIGFKFAGAGVSLPFSWSTGTGRVPDRSSNTVIAHGNRCLLLEETPKQGWC